MKGSLVQEEMTSVALKGNALRDPAVRALRVYLPPGYSAEGRRYPTAYFLHPFLSSGASWVQASAFSNTVPERLDGLIERGEVPPLIAVFPDGATRLGGTQWNNSPSMGRYQDYVANDVVGWVDGHYRATPTPEARAVLGRSSGGYGALLMGRDRPDVFGHLAANAADSFFEYCYLPDFPKAAASFYKLGGYEPWYADFLERVYRTKMRSEDPTTLNILAMAAAYSPNATAPLGLDLPFEAGSARIREEIFDRWKCEDPVRFAHTHAPAFKKLQTVFLDCGSRDEFNLRWGIRMVADQLKSEGVTVLHEEFDDGHSGTNYRFDRALTVLGPRLAMA